MALVGGSLTHDDNFLRRPAGAEREETVTRAFVGLRVDKPYAQQRFLLDATVTANRHDNFPQLDFDATQYRGAWNWHLTPRASGVLSAERSEALVNFADERFVGERNVRRSESQSFSANYRVFGGWQLTGGLTRREERTSRPVVEEGSYSADGAEAGVRYVTGRASTVSLIARTLDGDYDRPPVPAAFIGPGFTRDELELSVTWIATAKSTLDARLARIDYREELFPQRDFEANGARLAWRWAPTARLGFTVEAGRSVTPWRDTSAVYRTEDRVALGTTWQLAARTTLGANLAAGSSYYHKPLVPLAGAARHDTFRAAGLSFAWRALRNLSLTASLQREDRDANVPGAAYRTTVGTAGASLLF